MKRKEYKTEYKKYQRQRKKGESKRARKDRIKCETVKKYLREWKRKRNISKE